MKIGEFIEKVHTTKDTVRHYEYLGLLNPQRHQKRRIYGEKEINDFHAIKEMQSLDLSLKEIQALFEMKQTNGCGSNELFVEVIYKLQEKQQRLLEAEQMIKYKREQMSEILGILTDLKKRK